MRTLFLLFFLSFQSVILAIPLSPFYNLASNPYITAEMQKEIKPYCLPENHPLVALLDSIFADKRVTENEETFKAAGFKILFSQPTSYIKVARHLAVPGYLFKLYLDNETRKKQDIEGWKWLVKRCIGAENIRKLIHRKKLKYFTVPDKWIYPLPGHLSLDPLQQPIVLIVQDMDLASGEETKRMWQKAGKKQIDELFIILSHGFSSCYLAQNIPYSRSGKFACIDTEHPKRKLNYHHTQAYLSPPMKNYWKKLTKH
ncbi:MAG TPA: hypothetical protein PLC42_03800 [Parachlamydiaceae bacterium]|nr:hypothetical protein [Parachlamydiaceae bacterium]